MKHLERAKTEYLYRVMCRKITNKQYECLRKIIKIEDGKNSLT